jgi:hypothetical protein
VAKRASLIALLSLLIISTMAIASYSSTITLKETSGTDYDATGFIIPINVTSLVDLNYIESDGLDTRVLEGSTEIPHLLVNDKILFATDLNANSSKSLSFTTGNTDTTSMSIITGYGGYITVTDVASWEPGNNFSDNFTDLSLDTSVADYVLLKDGAYTITKGSGNITASIHPVVAATNTSSTSPVNTNHVVNLPAGLTSGNLLMILFATRQSTTVNTPAGWTQLFNDQFGAGEGKLAVFHKVSNGGEGASVTITTTGTVTSAHTSHRIVGVGTPVAGTTVTGSSANPNPPLLTPVAGSNMYLWFAVSGGRDTTGGADFTATGYPSGYSGGLEKGDNTGFGAGVASAYKLATAASEDPGTFTLSTTSAWGANTIAIPPSATVSSAFSGTHDCIIASDSTNLTLTIDGVLEDSITLGGASVANNANNWIIKVPSMSSYKHYVSGTLIGHYEPTSLISGTTLPDREGTAENGAITWGTNPSGVTLTMGSLLSATETSSSETGSIEPDAMPTNNMPGLTQGESSLQGENHILYSVVSLVNNDTGYPIVMIWGFLVVLFVLTMTLGTFRWTNNMLLSIITMIICLAFSGGMSLVPSWIMIIPAGIGFGIIVMEKSGGF